MAELNGSVGEHSASIGRLRADGDKGELATKNFQGVVDNPEENIASLKRNDENAN